MKQGRKRKTDKTSYSKENPKKIKPSKTIVLSIQAMHGKKFPALDTDESYYKKLPAFDTDESESDSSDKSFSGLHTD